jgi:RHS repeat-associated protein
MPLGTTNYLYDGPVVLEELDQNGTLLVRYTQGPEADEPLAELVSSSTSYYEADGLGTITSLANPSGTIISTYGYDTFGNLIASSGTTRNPFRYTGRELDSETGSFYYRARYYDQASGRFLSEDPIAFRSGLNFYAYVGNRVNNFTDPSGLAKVCCRKVRHYPARWMGACHCFVQLSDGTTLGGYFSGFFGLAPQMNNNADRHPADPPTCRDLGSGCDLDKRLLKSFNDLPKNVGTYGWDGTSNHVASLILSGGGFPGYDLSPCAWGSDPFPRPSLPSIPNQPWPLWPGFPDGGLSKF